MVEIPTKNAAAYASIYQNLTALAAKHNDTKVDKAADNKDVVVLSAASNAMYSSGDAVDLKVDLAKGTLSVTSSSNDYRAYRASLSMEKTATGFTASESLHNERGLTQRTFAIENEQVRVLSESAEPTPLTREDGQAQEQLASELGYAAGSLQYLLGPSFKG